MKISMENLKGRKVPRGGLKDQTKGKQAGTRNVRGPMNSPFNFAPSGAG
jgi:hypothetical protein